MIRALVGFAALLIILYLVGWFVAAIAIIAALMWIVNNIGVVVVIVGLWLYWKFCRRAILGPKKSG